MKYKQSYFNGFRNQKGALIIELMIGLLMSSITIFVALAMYSKFEGEKRTVVQVGQSVSNLSLASFQIEQSAKSAGFGVPMDDAFNCSVLGYSSKSLSGDISFSLLPVEINVGSTSIDSDTISFISGSNYFSTYGKTLQQPSSQNNGDLLLDNKDNISPNDAIVIYEATKKCTLAQVSEISPTTNLIKREVNANTTLNQVGGVTGGVNYAANSLVYNLGQNPSIVNYKITNQQLRQLNILSGEDYVLADNIVLLKARYGIDSNSDGKVDSWAKTFTNFSNVKSVLIGLWIKSPIREKKENNACIVTKNGKFDFGSEIIDINGIIPDWDCYRYKFIKTEYPLRNVFWKNQS